MGDRAVINVKGSGISIYLHWNGREAGLWVKEAVEAGAINQGDEQYSVARLTQFLANKVDGDKGQGNTSIGLWSGIKDDDYSYFDDAGGLQLDVDKMTLVAKGGYLGGTFEEMCEGWTTPPEELKKYWIGPEPIDLKDLVPANAS